MPVKVKGFTLIETIVGIVVLSIAFSVITSLIYPMVEHSADQLHQIRAAELGQSMLNEIQNKAFDEKSDMAGGVYRCGEDYDSNGTLDSDEQCTANNALGSEEANRMLFDDVDDYDALEYGDKYSAGGIEDAQGNSLGLYIGYAMQVSVCNDGDYDGDCSDTSSSDTSSAKLITVTITTPTGFDLVFSTYRANF